SALSGPHQCCAGGMHRLLGQSSSLAIEGEWRGVNWRRYSCHLCQQQLAATAGQSEPECPMPDIEPQVVELSCSPDDGSAMRGGRAVSCPSARGREIDSREQFSRLLLDELDAVGF